MKEPELVSEISKLRSLSPRFYVPTPQPCLKVVWLLYLPPGLAENTAVFRPHSVFVCSVWISEQTTIISLYSTNWLVFMNETECLLRRTS
jgi:hypothetical protein